MSVDQVARGLAAKAGTPQLGPVAGFFGHVAGKSYLCGGQESYATASSATPTVPATVFRFMPFILKEAVTLSALMMRISSGAANNNLQLALYAADPVSKKPSGNPLYSSATTPCTASGVLTIACNLSLQPGLYWLGLAMDLGTSTFIGGEIASAEVMKFLGVSTVNSNGVGLFYGFFQGYNLAGQTYGTWPNMTSTNQNALSEVTGNALPSVAYTVGSIP